MKKILSISSFIIIICFVFGTTNLKAQTISTKTEIFKVYGNCEMCQDRIEGALKKKDGIVKKSWSESTKMLTVTFDSDKLSLIQIKQKIADAGYDTDDIQATDDAYHNLPKCCQYKRTKTTK
jgi:periplasmic mercuric ion binding protein